MKKSRSTDRQNAFAMRRAEAGTPVAGVLNMTKAQESGRLTRYIASKFLQMLCSFIK
jgi:hypothetical protein